MLKNKHDVNGTQVRGAIRTVHPIPNLNLHWNALAHLIFTSLQDLEEGSNSMSSQCFSFFLLRPGFF